MILPVDANIAIYVEPEYMPRIILIFEICLSSTNIGSFPERAVTVYVFIRHHTALRFAKVPIQLYSATCIKKGG